MPQPFTDACVASAEEEVDAEFGEAAGLEAMIEAELLVDDVSFDRLDAIPLELHEGALAGLKSSI